MVGDIAEPGYLEGGDFFPAGRDLALLGIGLRSNFEACKQVGCDACASKASRSVREICAVRLRSVGLR